MHVFACVSITPLPVCVRVLVHVTTVPTYLCYQQGCCLVMSGQYRVGQSVDSDSYKKASTFGFTIKVSRVLSTEVLRNIKEGYTIYVPKIYSVCEK